jgi:hypothetical protein
MNVLLSRGTPSPKRIRGTFLRHEPTRRTCFYAAERVLFRPAAVPWGPGVHEDESGVIGTPGWHGWFWFAG